MLEQYGFDCDCEACSLTGEKREENNKQRRLVDDLDLVIERLLYEFPNEENIHPVKPCHQIDFSLPWLDKMESSNEDSDLSDILTAIKLNYYKLYLMDRIGFKVVSQVNSVLRSYS